MKTILQTLIMNLTRYTAVIALLMLTLQIPISAQSRLSPSLVNLRSAGDFVIIAKTAVSTTGTTAITGDLGVSPSAATFITGFGLIMDVSNTYSISSLVTGKIYAADYTTPTPAKMTTAISDMETAYTDAAGRVLPDYTELYSGDLTGKTLTPGLYKWSTGVNISAGGVTISGNSDDVWIFQIAQNLGLSSAAKVTLIGGAQASHIFWQVAGQVTMGTTSAMQGNILCKTKIVMSTGASLFGRALAQTAVTLDGNAVVKPTTISAVTNTIGAPLQFSMDQNYPNPFNPATTINFTLANNGNTKLAVFDALGRNVKTIVNEYKPAGIYSVQVNGYDLVSGIYIYRLESGNYSITRKFILMK